MKTLTKIIAGMCFLPLLAVAGCAAETDPSLGTDEQALEGDSKDIADLAFTAAVAAWARDGGQISSASADTAYALEDVEGSAPQGKDIATARWTTFMNAMKDASVRYNVQASTFRLISEVPSPGAKKTFILANGMTLKAGTMDYVAQANGIVLKSSLSKPAAAYVGSTRCGEEFLGGAGTFGPGNPCTKIAQYAKDIVVNLNAGAPGLANAAVRTQRLTPSGVDWLLTAEVTFDPINADEALTSVVTAGSSLCALSPLTGISYINNAQAVDSHCTKANAQGVPLNNATWAQGLRLVNSGSNRKCQ